MKTCENLSKCVYGSQVFKGNEQVIEIYKILYCEAGDSKITACKRYQVIRAAGYCPSYVLPNSMSSIESILEKMRQEKKVVKSK